MARQPSVGIALASKLPDSMFANQSKTSQQAKAEPKGKNWPVESMLDELVTETTTQAVARQAHLPPNAQQHVIFDVRGQDVPQPVRQRVVEHIVRESHGTLRADHIHFLEASEE